MVMPSDILAPLFVPAHRPELFEKAAQSGADALILDLEDAVPREAKDRARAALRTDFTGLPVIVRINALGTPWFEADLLAVMALKPAAVMVPKAEASALATLVDAQARDAGLPVIALIETARGLADAEAIARMAGVTRLAFGSIDFCVDLGCAHTSEALAQPRFALVMASRLAGRAAPLDGVTTSLDDAELIQSEARRARDLGFGGKLCIHPRQIGPVRAGFAPDDEEIRWAERILASGDGAVAIDGAIVDEPVRLRARAILARMETGRR